MKNYKIRPDDDVKNPNFAMKSLDEMCKEVIPEEYAKIDVRHKLERAEYIKQQHKKKKTNHQIKLDGDMENVNLTIKAIGEICKEVAPEEYAKIEAENKRERAKYLEKRRQEKKKKKS